MRRFVFAASITLVILLSLPAQVSATKWPNLYFDVTGKIVDRDSKKPIHGATVLVFLNDSPYADNSGWTKTASNAGTDRSGRYVTRAILHRGQKVPSKLKVEVIVLREGYRTERFVFRDVGYRRTKISTARYGLIKLGTTTLLALRKR